MRRAAIAHREQNRKGGDVPYVSHPAMVALLLQRYGFTETETLAAALLHDVVEDTNVSEAELRQEFGDAIADLVHCVSETKKDAGGTTLPWEVRKQSKLAKLQNAPVGAKAIALADKLHNLHSTLDDERAGVPIWSRFNATKDRWLLNAERVITICEDDDPRLKQLAAVCRELIEILRGTDLIQD
jgi:(p)ppGpp synthase/HD superfamily hydrolase